MESITKTISKLRIGVMTRDIEELNDYEYRILEGIIEHPSLELVLFIKDGRHQTGNSFAAKLKRNLLTSKVFTNILFWLQLKIESLLFRQNRATTINANADRNAVAHKLKDIATIDLCPERKRFVDAFSCEDSEKVKAYNLDIILRHEFNIIRGDILNAARFGIWSFHHADNAINRGYPPGFWEIVNDEPCCGVTLQQLTPELDGGRIIDKAWFDRHWSFYKNNNDLLDKSVVLLFKNIEKLLRQGELETTKSLVYYNRLYSKPTFGYLAQYLVNFYANVFTRALKILIPFGRPNCWRLFFARGDFLEAALYRIEPAPMPRKVFWADPFLFRDKNSEQIYVFFENFSYKAKKGKISVGKIVENSAGKIVENSAGKIVENSAGKTVESSVVKAVESSVVKAAEKGVEKRAEISENNVIGGENSSGKRAYSIVEVRDAINLGYHMSYPQIVEEDGEIYMIPETVANKRLEVFHCVGFPDKWELFATAFEGEEVVDTTYYCDEDGARWLFVNKGRAPEAELYIYGISSLKLESIVSHKSNPVLIDCRRGRNGGAVFRYGSDCYRPSQINTHGVYGKGLQISKIEKLTLDEFIDEAVVSIEPNFRKGLVGIHHLHQIEGRFIFDACYGKSLL